MKSFAFAPVEPVESTTIVPLGATPICVGCALRVTLPYEPNIVSTVWDEARLCSV